MISLQQTISYHRSFMIVDKMGRIPKVLEKGFEFEKKLGLKSPLYSSNVLKSCAWIFLSGLVIMFKISFFL